METAAPTGESLVDGVHRRIGGVSWRPLTVLACLFAARVVAQFVQWVATIDALPAFDSWQSGTLPYPLLLGSQVVVLLVQLLVIGRVRAGSYHPGRRTRRGIFVLGALYLLAMVARLVSGLTWADGHAFLDASLPSLFHLVLAGFVILLALAGDPDADGRW